MSENQNAIIDLNENQASPPSYSECFNNEINNNKGKFSLKDYFVIYLFILSFFNIEISL